MAGCIEVTKSLRKREPRRKERILDAQNLGHAARPANALTDMRGKALRCKAGSPGNIDVCGVPAIPLDAQCSMRILGDRLYGDAANLVEGAAPQHRARTAKKACVPQVVPILHKTVEEFAFVGNSSELSEVSLKRIRGIEMMRGLQQSQVAVPKKPSQRDL